MIYQKGKEFGGLLFGVLQEKLRFLKFVKHKRSAIDRKTQNPCEAGEVDAHKKKMTVVAVIPAQFRV